MNARDRLCQDIFSKAEGFLMEKYPGKFPNLIPNALKAPSRARIRISCLIKKSLNRRDRMELLVIDMVYIGETIKMQGVEINPNMEKIAPGSARAIENFFSSL